MITERGHIMKEIINELTVEELSLLEDEIKSELIIRFRETNFEEFLDDICFDESGKFICRHCDSSNTLKAGINATEKQRYKCNDCGKIMIKTTGMITFSSKKGFNQWVLYLESLLNGDTIETSAEKANISLRTSFRWRHKIMYALNTLMNKEVLSDTVTVDETLFPVVYKNKNIPRDETVAKKRGMSNQKINVTCAIDSNNNIVLKVIDRGRVKADSLINAYSGLIKKDSIVVSDSLRSYHKLMDYLEIDWKKIPSKKKSLGEFTLDPVNRLHASLKDFIYKYKGISIKYLQGYLALFSYQRSHKKHFDRFNLLEMVSQIFCIKSHIRCYKLDASDEIY